MPSTSGGEHEVRQRRRRNNSADASSAMTNGGGGGATGGATEQPPHAPQAAAPSRPQQAALPDELVELGMRLLIIFVIWHIAGDISKRFLPSTPSPSAAPDAALKALKNSGYTNSWSPQLPYELRMYLREEDDLSGRDDELDLSTLLSLTPVWQERGLVYSEPGKGNRTYSANVALSDDFVQRNGSLFAHVLLLPTDSSPQTLADVAIHRRFNLVEWRPRKVKAQPKHLVGGWLQHADERSAEPAAPKDGGADGATEYLMDRWYKPDLYVRFMVDHHRVYPERLNAEMAQLFHLNDTRGTFEPPLEWSELWLLKEAQMNANSTVKEVPLTVHFTPMGITKFAWLWVLEHGVKSTMGVLGQASTEEQQESLKSTIVSTHPLLLATTAVVTVAHIVLEMLAFRSDISHWSDIKSVEGISVRSMFWNVGMSLVTFLYLVDNETSLVIMASAGFGVLLEVWKLPKLMDFRDFGSRRLLGFIPWFTVHERESYTKTRTKEYDEVAMRYLGYVLYPCIALYAAYSLLYHQHRSWYSWAVSSLVGAVYVFGFIMMFPQIFINYKLKSVAHLPLKTFMYKALNTVIDDLFSFIIKMPILHRLACFRDDIVFAVLLYQRWIYPVDKKRVNEFGQVFDDDSDSSKRRIRSSAKRAQVEPAVGKKKRQRRVITSGASAGASAAATPAASTANSDWSSQPSTPPLADTKSD